MCMLFCCLSIHQNRAIEQAPSKSATALVNILSHLVNGERGAWDRGDPFGVAPGVARGVAPGVLRSVLRASASCFPATLSGTRPCKGQQTCVTA